MSHHIGIFFFIFVSLQAREPKDTISLDDLNVAFVPEKLGNPNGIQITYLKNGQTRNLFLYCDNSQVKKVKLLLIARHFFHAYIS